MTRYDVVAVGEALVDIVRASDGVEAEAPGGSPANVALTLGRRGRSVALVTRLGDDERGATVREWLAESGVEVVVTPAERTSTALAVLDASGAATYEFDLRWELADQPFPDARILHHGSIASVLTPGADTLEALVEAARDASTVISYDPNIRPSLIEDEEDARERVARHIAAADLVKASDEDVEWLHPGADPQEVAQAWLEEGPSLVVITAGAAGAFAAYPGGIVGVPAPSVRVVDTVGAGDTVMGALIAGLIELSGAEASGEDVRAVLASLDAAAIEALLEQALASAAITVSRPGADPPWSAELS